VVYGTQPERQESQGAIPIPSILLFVNQSDLLVDSYRKYLDSQIRTLVAWSGLPLKFYFKEREARGRRAHTS
jgi:predicted GTPase